MIATQTKTRAKKPAKAAPPTPDYLEFAKAAAKLAADTRCSAVLVLDVRGLSPVTDFFVIATGTSGRQMKSVSNDIEELAAEHQDHVMNRSIDEHWVLLDFVNVVVHIFDTDARLYYDLEGLYGDAKRVEWR
ncbi:MAG TPA: ribosome silencing factor [Tepidisphaeraceae bacterium]